MPENAAQMDIQREAGGRVSGPAKLDSRYLKRKAVDVDDFLGARPNVIRVLNNLSDYLAETYGVSQIVLECDFEHEAPSDDGERRKLRVTPKYNTADPDELAKIQADVFTEYLYPLGPSAYDPLIVSFSSRLSGYDNATEYL